MSLLDPRTWFASPDNSGGVISPRNSVQSAGGGVVIQTTQQLEQHLLDGALSESGALVTPEAAMKVAAVYACCRIISGPVSTLPLPIKRRIDDRTRETASDLEVWRLLKKPNAWQTPSQFKRMMQTHQLLRGNAYAKITWYRGQPIQLMPLHPARVRVKQLSDSTLSYEYITKDGRKETYAQKEMFHLVGLTLDGVNGVTPITYARETIGLSLAMEDHGARAFANGAKMSGTLSHPGKLGKEGQENLKASLDEYRAGGAREGKDLLLEEGMKYERIALTPEDMQWIDSRKLTRSDIAMFFGVPPHMIGDTEKSTSWGTGIEQQSNGFVAYSLEDYLTMWEETIDRDLITDPQVYARFNRAALVKGDLKARWEAYVKALQWGVSSPNEIRALEEENPREGGDVYYDPPNTAGAGSQEASQPEPEQ